MRQGEPVALTCTVWSVWSTALQAFHMGHSEREMLAMSRVNRTPATCLYSQLFHLQAWGPHRI